jgi:hypothetical protein
MKDVRSEICYNSYPHKSIFTFFQQDLSTNHHECNHYCISFTILYTTTYPFTNGTKLSDCYFKAAFSAVDCKRIRNTNFLECQHKTP